MAEINLLPAKEFEIILADGAVIAGKFGTWAAQRFCDKKNIDLVQLFELLVGEVALDEDKKPIEVDVPDGKGGTIKQPLRRSKMKLSDHSMTLLCAVEYKSKKDKKGFAYTDVDACEWIDEMGGIDSEMYSRLCNHASSDLEPVKESEEKKSL